MLPDRHYSAIRPVKFQKQHLETFFQVPPNLGADSRGRLPTEPAQDRILHTQSTIRSVQIPNFGPKTPKESEKSVQTVTLLGCRKWGFKRWRFKEIRGYLRKKAFFLRFLDFPGALRALRKRAKKAEKGRKRPILADFQEGAARHPLNPHMLHPHLRQPNSLKAKSGGRENLLTRPDLKMFKFRGLKAVKALFLKLVWPFT